MPELHDYVNADIRLDPEHDDLPREQVFKFEEKVIESRVQRSNSTKIQAEIHALALPWLEPHFFATLGNNRQNISGAISHQKPRSSKKCGSSHGNTNMHLENACKTETQ